MAKKIDGNWFFDSDEVERIFENSIETDSSQICETDILRTAMEMDIPLDRVQRQMESIKREAMVGHDYEMQTKRIAGAGGTSGGIGQFFMGLVMMVSGGYLFTNMVKVSTRYFHSYSLFGSGITITPFGITLIPLCMGIFWLFFDGKSKLGWILTIGSMLAIFVGILASLEIHMYRTNLYQLGITLVLLIGGLGLFLRSLKPQ